MRLLDRLAHLLIDAFLFVSAAFCLWALAVLFLSF